MLLPLHIVFESGLDEKIEERGEKKVDYDNEMSGEVLFKSE
jgi:hypothetical protein